MYDMATIRPGGQLPFKPAIWERSGSVRLQLHHHRQRRARIVTLSPINSSHRFQISFGCGESSVISKSPFEVAAYTIRESRGSTAREFKAPDKPSPNRARGSNNGTPTRACIDRLENAGACRGESVEGFCGLDAMLYTLPPSGPTLVHRLGPATSIGAIWILQLVYLN